MRKAISPEEADQIRDCLRICRDQSAGDEARNQAAQFVENFLHDQLFGVAVHQVRKYAANGLSAHDIFQEAFLNLLQQFRSGTDKAPADEQSLCQAFVNLLYLRTIDHLRERVPTPVGELIESGADSAQSGRMLRAAMSLLRLQQAVIWLDREHPELSAAFKARLLINPNVRFSQAGQSISRFIREQVITEDPARRFDEMATLLGVSRTEAHKRYQNAVQLLREQLPELVPGDFRRAD